MPNELIQVIKFVIDLKTKGLASGTRNVVADMQKMSKESTKLDNNFKTFSKIMNTAQKATQKLLNEFASGAITMTVFKDKLSDIDTKMRAALPQTEETVKSMIFFQNALKKSAKEAEKFRISLQKIGGEAFKNTTKAVNKYARAQEKLKAALRKTVTETRKANMGRIQEAALLENSKFNFLKLSQAIAKTTKELNVNKNVSNQVDVVLKKLRQDASILEAEFRQGLITQKKLTDGYSKLTRRMIALRIKGFKGTRKELERHILGLNLASKATERLGGATQGILRFFSRWRNRLLVLTFALAGLVRGIKSFVIASVNAERQTIALGIIAVKTGQSVRTVTEAAQSLAKDGILSFEGASQALKNLLSTGADLPIIVANLNAMKDAALANGRAAFSAEENIILYTQGIKEMKSQLTDSAGVMTNISDIMKRVTKDSKGLSDANALLVEFTKEAGLFSGTLERSLNTLGGQMQIAKTAARALSIELGNKLQPISKKLVAIYLQLIGKISVWIDKEENLNRILQFTEETLKFVITLVQGLKNAFVQMSGPISILVSLLEILIILFNKLGESGIKIISWGIELFVVLKIVQKFKIFTEVLKTTTVAMTVFGVSTKIALPLLTLFAVAVVTTVEAIKALVKWFTRIKEGIDLFAKANEGVFQEAAINAPKLRQMLIDYNDATREGVKITKDLQATLLDLLNFEKEAFAIRTEMKRVEKNKEIQNTIDKLKRIKTERDKEIESLQQQFKLNQDLRQLAIDEEFALQGITDVERKKLLKIIKDTRTNMESLVSSIKNFQEGTTGLDKEIDGLTKSMETNNQISKLMIEQFETNKLEKFAKGLDTINASFERLANRIRKDALKSDIGSVSDLITNFGAPGARIARGREAQRSAARGVDITTLIKGRLTKAEDIFGPGGTKEDAKKFQAAKALIFKLGNDLIELEEKTHQDNMGNIDDLAFRERLRKAGEFAKKLFDMTVGARKADERAAEILRRVSLEKIEIDLRKGLISETEAEKQRGVLKDQAVLTENSANKKRVANIQDMIAAELLAKAALWAIEGPIQFFAGNKALGLAMIAGAAAAGIASNILQGLATENLAQAAVLDARAAGLGGDAFDGQGRVISGTINQTTPQPAQVNATVNITAGDGVIAFGTDIEDVTDSFETALNAATQRAVDSGAIKGLAAA